MPWDWPIPTDTEIFLHAITVGLLMKLQFLDSNSMEFLSNGITFAFKITNITTAISLPISFKLFFVRVTILLFLIG